MWRMTKFDGISIIILACFAVVAGAQGETFGMGAICLGLGVGLHRALVCWWWSTIRAIHADSPSKAMANVRAVIEDAEGTT